MVPVAMAYAGLAGMPPETGLVTAFARDDRVRHLRHLTPPQGHGQLVGGDHVGVGGGRDRRAAIRAAYVPLSAALALMVGIILLVAGAARLGFLSQFLAASVVTGFVIGLAVTITVGQIPALLGIPSVSGTIIEKLVQIAESLDELNT